MGLKIPSFSTWQGLSGDQPLWSPPGTRSASPQWVWRDTPSAQHLGNYKGVAATRQEQAAETDICVLLDHRQERLGVFDSADEDGLTFDLK